jgi:ABC-2 type transport system permease protein
MIGKNAELLLEPVRSIRRAVILWAVAVGGLIFMTVAVWPAFKGASGLSQALDQLPSGIVQAFGLQGIGTPAGFLRGNIYDLFGPLVLAGAAIGFANSLTSGEEDAGRLEVTLAQPVTRQAIFLGRALAVLVGVAVVTLAATVVQFGSDAIFDLQIASDRLLATLILCALLALLHAGLALALAGLVAKPSAVLGVGIFAAVAGALVAALFPLTGSLEWLAHVSPWDWAFAGDPLVNGAEPWRYLVLAVPAVLLTAFGTWAFSRRDVSAP